MTRIKRVNRRFRILSIIPVLLALILVIPVSADMRVQPVLPPVEEQQEHFKKPQFDSPIVPQIQPLSVDGSLMRQVLFGGIGSAGALHTTLVRYNGIGGGYTWGSDAIGWHNQLISIPGTLSNMEIELSGAPGAGKSYTFVLIKNGANTTLTTTISDSDTSGNDLVNSVAVVPGDSVRIMSTPSGTPSGVNARYSFTFDGNTANESLILGTGECIQALTRYVPISHNLNLSDSTESRSYEIIPTPGSIKNLYLLMSESPGGGDKAYIFTLRLNGNDTLLTATITGDAVRANNTANEVTVTAGDIVTLEVTPVNTPTDLPLLAFGTTFVADTNGESIVLGTAFTSPNTGTPQYTQLATGSLGLSWNNTESARYQLGQSTTLRNLYVLLDVAPGGGKSFTFSAGNTSLSTTISGAATTGTNLVDTLVVSNGDEVSLMSVPSGTPASTAVHWGLVSFYVAPTPPRILNIQVDGKVLVSP